MPASSTRRDCATVKAPVSQNTSIDFEYGAQASSMGPVTRSTYSSERSAYSSERSAYSAGTTCAPRKVTSGVTSAARRTSRSSSATLRP